MPAEVTPIKRAHEFKDQGLIVKSGKLNCKHCGYAFTSTKKSVVENHLNSKQHKLSSSQTGTNRALDFGADQLQEDFVHDLVQTMARVNIPLHKLSHPEFQRFNKRWLREGVFMPSLSTIRRELPILYQEEVSRLREFFRNSKIAIIIDETTDEEGRKAVQILFQKLDFTSDFTAKLVDTTFLEEVNYGEITRAVSSALTTYQIDLSNVMVYATDNVKYMIKSFRECLNVLLPNCTHITCFAHIIALVGETWRETLEDVDNTVARMKAIFSLSGLRRRRLLEFFSNKGVPNPTLYPSPVLTRWGTWFMAVHYIAMHFDHLKAFIDAELEIDETADLKVLKQLFATPHLQNDLNFVSNKCDRLRFMILEFERQDLLLSDVYEKLNNLYLWMMSSLDQYRVLEADQDEQFATTLFEASSAKLHKYLKEGAQPGMQLIEFARYLNPFVASSSNNQLSALKPPSFLFSKIREEWPFYLRIAADQQPANSQAFDLRQWWSLQKGQLPNIYSVAKWILAVPSSTCDAERAFSKYKEILAPNRRSMLPSTIKYQNALYFNRYKKDLNAQNDESDDDDMPLFLMEEDNEEE